MDLFSSQQITLFQFEKLPCFFIFEKSFSQSNENDNNSIPFSIQSNGFFKPNVIFIGGLLIQLRSILLKTIRNLNLFVDENEQQQQQQQQHYLLKFNLIGNVWNSKVKIRKYSNIICFEKKKFLIGGISNNSEEEEDDDDDEILNWKDCWQYIYEIDVDNGNLIRIENIAKFNFETDEEEICFVQFVSLQNQIHSIIFQKHQTTIIKFNFELKQWNKLVSFEKNESNPFLNEIKTGISLQSCKENVYFYGGKGEIYKIVCFSIQFTFIF